jgi:Tfp pilus assembly protein PilO
MKISTRESFLALITGAVVLFGMTGMLGRSQLDNLKKIRSEQEQVRDNIKRSRRLVSQKEKWTVGMDKVKGMIPSFPKSKRMDVYWSSEMEKLAGIHDLTIIRHEVGSEHQEGPIYELPVECRDWEGSLDSLVHFLFDLQGKGAMLDIRYLRIKPKNKTIRKGRFSLYCAYMRDSS